VFALHAKGEEKAAIAELEQMYLTYLPQDFWTFWPHKLLSPFYHSSFVDNTKMVNMLDVLLTDKPFKRKFSWQAVNIDTA
jgi:hypothetical protein